MKLFTKQQAKALLATFRQYDPEGGYDMQRHTSALRLPEPLFKIGIYDHTGEFYAFL